MFKISALIKLVFGLSILFFLTQCKKTKGLMPEQRLTEIQSYRNGILSKQTIQYEGSRIIRIGITAFLYNKSGQVEKEVDSVGKLIVVYNYKWDSFGRLAEIKFSKSESSNEVNFGAFYIQPDRQFFYIGNSGTIDKIIRNDIKFASTQNIFYYYKSGVIDSVSIHQIDSPEANGYVFKESYSPWLTGFAQSSGGSSAPNTIFKMDFPVNLHQDSPNYIRQAFQSLGFVPTQVEVIPFYAKFIDNLIDIEGYQYQIEDNKLVNVSYKFLGLIDSLSYQGYFKFIY